MNLKEIKFAMVIELILFAQKLRREVAIYVLLIADPYVPHIKGPHTKAFAVNSRIISLTE